MAEMEVELPKALIKRIVKAKLAEQADDSKRDFQVNKDAATAFSQATKVFITYVSSAAHDICRENNRTTVASQDIIQALEELCFQDFISDLQELLSDLQSKKKMSKDAGKAQTK